jgi:hypothetical protein
VLIREIIFEDEVSDEIAIDLMDIITTSLQDNKTEIDMATVINSLRGQRFDVSSVLIRELLQTPMFSGVFERIDGVPPSEKIVLKKDEPDFVSKDEKAKSQEKVEKMASKVAKDAVKAGDKI